MWRKSKIIYDGKLNGEYKELTECFLNESVSLGEVEAQLAKELQPRIKSGIQVVEAAAKINLADVVFYPMQEDDFFWSVVVHEWVNAKRKAYTYIVPALDYTQAGERMEEYLEDFSNPWRIHKVAETDILAVWHPNNELWIGDWRNRMERLESMGRSEVVYEKQGELFKKDGSTGDEVDKETGEVKPTISVKDPSTGEWTDITKALEKDVKKAKQSRKEKASVKISDQLFNKFKT